MRFRPQDLGAFLIASVGYGSLSLLLGPITVGGPTVLNPAAGLVLPVTIIGGPVLGAGCVVGSIAAGVLVGGFGPAFAAETVALVGGIAILGGREETDSSIGDRTLDLLVAVATVAVLTAWGWALLGIAPFYVTALSRLGELGFSTVAVVLVGTVVARVLEYSPTAPPGSSLPVRSTPGRLERIVLVSWFGVGCLVSLGYTVAGHVPRAALVDRGLGFVWPVLDPAVVGVGGRRVQALVGATMATGLAAAWLRTAEVTDL